MQALPYQAHLLSRLTPQTLADITGVNFTARARAMPGVLNVLDRIEDVPCIDPKTGAETEDEIDVSKAMRLPVDVEEQMIVLPRHVVVGGLAYDHVAENPLVDDDGSGSILHLSRDRADAEERERAFSAIGLTLDGEPDIEAFPVRSRLADEASAAVRKDARLMRRLATTARRQTRSALWDDVAEHFRSTVLDTLESAGWRYLSEEISRKCLGQEWNALSEADREVLGELGALTDEDAGRRAWQHAWDAREVGNPYAQLLDIYEHGGVSYSLAGRGMNDQWDTSRGAAVWVPKSGQAADIEEEAARRLGLTLEVRAFGAGTGGDDPLRFAISRDAGKTWVGGYATEAQARAAARKGAGDASQQAAFAAKCQEVAEAWARGDIETYNDYCNGAVYGVIAYVIDRETGERIDEFDEECWGFVGSDYAGEELERALLSLVARLQAKPH